MMDNRHIKKSFKQYIKSAARECSQGNTPLNICTNLLLHDERRPEFLASTDLEEQYYWLGNIYTSLIPKATKIDLAAHFTPPHIARYTITRAKELGFNIISSQILDPASGGSAFLVPLSIAIIKQLKSAGKTDDEIGLHITEHLSGIEIDYNLAQLSRIILNNLISKRLPSFNIDLSHLIRNNDSLRVVGQNDTYDAIFSNPPYGKILNPPVSLVERFADSPSDTNFNKYALFIRLSIDWVRPGGFIALILPTSFIAGPSFGNLRKSILKDTHILAIDLLDKRDDLFVDVLQDACILFLKKKQGHSQEALPICRLLHEDGTHQDLGQIGIPSMPSIRPWVLPLETACGISTNDFFSESYANLSDYGYGIRAGYFVWNRQKERCREGDNPTTNEFPLIWAHCVKANEPCGLLTHRIHGQTGLMSLVRFDTKSDSLISRPAIILQRTTNRRQARRLIAGYIPQCMIDEHGSLISENHTIVIYSLPGIEPQISYETMCQLLNSRPVDNRYRQISGTVSVSVKLLRELPLPPPTIMKNKLNDYNDSAQGFDEMVEDCYREAAGFKP